MQNSVTQITSLLKKREQETSSKREWALHRAETIKSFAEPEWQQLRKWLQDICPKLNTEMGREVFRFGVLPSSQFRIEAKIDGNTKIMTGEFHLDTRRIFYEGREKYFFADVDENGDFVYRDGSEVSAQEITVEQMGHKIIAQLCS